MGYSVTTLAKNSRQTGPKASPKGPRGMENALELSQLFAERYPYNGKSQSTNLDAVEKYVKEQFSDPENFSIEGAHVTEEVAAQVCYNNVEKHAMHNTTLINSFVQNRSPESTRPPPNSPPRPSSKAWPTRSTPKACI
jgi:hypothetical protein